MVTVVQQIGAVNSAALYAQLVADVYTLTNRPDLVAETALAIRKATLKAHNADFWVSDIVVVPQLTLPTAVTDPSQASSRYVLNLNDPATFPRLRKVSYIKPYISPTGMTQVPGVSGWDSLLSYGAGAITQKNYVEVTASSVVDDYGLERTNYWYQAGKQVNLRIYTQVLAVVLGYWAYPDITSVAYNSWIASEYPDLIVEEAASNVFRMIGKFDEAQAYASNWQANIRTITAAQITVDTTR
jgi:hypothetical protein